MLQIHIYVGMPLMKSIWSNRLGDVALGWGVGGWVCHLAKSLYRLKRSPQAWCGQLNSAVTSFSMKNVISIILSSINILV